MRKSRVATFACILAAGAIQFACQRADPARPHVLLVVIDTLRKDHVSTYGYERDTTPRIDAWAAGGVVFDDAVAQASWTLPSMASLLTSTYAPEVEQAPGAMQSLADEATTVAEIFRGAGYRTLSVTTNPYNADPVNLMQGFERRDWQVSAPADWVVDRAIEHMAAARSDPEASGRPLFLYLHLMDVHEPRNPPPPYDNYFAAPDGRPSDASHRGNLRFSSGEDLDSVEFRAYRSQAISVYDGAVRFVDAQFGRLLEHMESSGDLEKWFVVLTSDHGTEFWEHVGLERELGLTTRLKIYGVGHGHSVFRELIRVPLVLAGPGVPRQRFRGQVRLLDIAPTLIGLTGIDASNYRFEGVDLGPALAAGTPPEQRTALSETWTSGVVQRSVRDDRYQMLRLGERELLFDRGSRSFVPLEAHAAEVMRLRAALDRTLTGIRRAPTEPLVLDPELVERLRTLGYAL